MRNVERRYLLPEAIARLQATGVLLDIGPGIRPQTIVACETHVCCEPCAEYVQRLVAEHPGNVNLSCTWEQALDLFPPGSVDAVVLLDVVEHIEKEEARRLLARTEEMARGQIVVFTPLGFMPQGADEERDAWGLGGTDWQVHRSGWEPDEFPGWDIIMSEDYHHEDAYGRPLDTFYGAFFAVRPARVAAKVGFRLRVTQRLKAIAAWLSAGLPGRAYRRARLLLAGRPAARRAG